MEDNTMKKNKKQLVWAISMLVISVISIIISIANICGIDLPDVLKVLLGATDLIAVAVMAYTTVRLYVIKK